MQNRKVGQPTSFSIQPLSWKPSYGADSTTLLVTFNKPWEYVSGETSWLTVSKKSGGSEVKEPDTEEITLNVTENTSASSSRSATLLFRSEEVEVRVSVEQAKHDAYTISINPTSISLENTSGSYKAVTVTANQGWTVTGAPEWLGVSKSTGSGNDTVTFTTQSANKLADMLKNDDPRAKLGKMTVQPTIRSIQLQPGSKGTYQVRWSEEEYSLSGSSTHRINNYVALFAVTVDPPTKEAELLINPLGLKIKDLTMSIESTSKAPTPAMQGGTSNET